MNQPTPVPDPAPRADELARLAAVLVNADARELAPEVYARGRARLEQYLASRFPTFSPTDRAEIAGEAVVRVLERATTQQASNEPLQPDRVAGYLMRTTHNLALDALRRRGRDTVTTGGDATDILASRSLSDDETVECFERSATVESVQAMIRNLYEEGETTLFQVATHLLDHIQRTGSVPSNRDTARALGLSHTAVANALRRLRPIATRDVIDEER